MATATVVATLVLFVKLDHFVQKRCVNSLSYAYKYDFHTQHKKKIPAEREMMINRDVCMHAVVYGGTTMGAGFSTFNVLVSAAALWRLFDSTCPVLSNDILSSQSAVCTCTHKSEFGSRLVFLLIFSFFLCSFVPFSHLALFIDG